jgi:hypothetical protein
VYLSASMREREREERVQDDDDDGCSTTYLEWSRKRGEKSDW